MTRLRDAIEDVVFEAGHEWGSWGFMEIKHAIDRAEASIMAAVRANIDDVRLSEEPVPGDADGPWATGFRAGWRAAREAVGR